jgi:homoserine kinase
MSAQRALIRVPATSANLGPGFDVFGLALDLWNETQFEIRSDISGVQVEIEGEGQGQLPEDETNLIAETFVDFYRQFGQPLPAGLKISCRNRIPCGSGLGSSSAAILAGLCGANELLGRIASPARLLDLAAGLEHHGDNVGPALLGGLVVVVPSETGWMHLRYDLPPITAVVTVPEFNLPTREARAALPQQIPFKDAVFNVGHAVLVMDSLRRGDLTLLAQAMQDRLHQPYRLKLIPGAQAALEAALRVDPAAAVTISGAGPGMIAFSESNAGEIGQEMKAAFEGAGLHARSWELAVTNRGAVVP